MIYLKAIITTLQKPALMLVAVMYLLIPLQKPLLQGFHSLEHAILSTASNHTHDDFDTVNHDHEHEAISFLSALFSSEKNSSNADMPSKEIQFDKHFQSSYNSSEFLQKQFVKNNFRYLTEAYFTVHSNETPPPEYLFS